jgi:hypothetical protein
VPAGGHVVVEDRVRRAQPLEAREREGVGDRGLEILRDRLVTDVARRPELLGQRVEARGDRRAVRPQRRDVVRPRAEPGRFEHEVAGQLLLDADAPALLPGALPVAAWELPASPAARHHAESAAQRDVEARAVRAQREGIGEDRATTGEIGVQEREAAVVRELRRGPAAVTELVDAVVADAPVVLAKNRCRDEGAQSRRMLAAA